MKNITVRYVKSHVGTILRLTAIIMISYASTCNANAKNHADSDDWDSGSGSVEDFHIEYGDENDFFSGTCRYTAGQPPDHHEDPTWDFSCSIKGTTAAHSSWILYSINHLHLNPGQQDEIYISGHAIDYKNHLPLISGTQLCMELNANESRGSLYKGVFSTKKCITYTGHHNINKCATADFTINHGILSTSEFNGATKSSAGSILCSNQSDVTLSFSPPQIQLSNGGRAHLTFSNNETSETVHVPANSATQYTVKSTLSFVGTIKPGVFTGSTTIISDIQ